MDTIQKATNPFAITKASHFTDLEILQNWVDISNERGFIDILKPTSHMPMIILGGKGSGKTHLMRYFSYTLQELRNADDVIKGITEDGYIGFYLRCSGINSFRFQGKGQSHEAWASVFAYYFELWLGQIVISEIDRLFNYSQDIRRYELTISKAIGGLFNSDIYDKFESFQQIVAELINLQNNIDNSVNNCVFTGKLTVNIELSAGNLIFGIPPIIANHIPSFQDLVFVYLIDEIENLTPDQQRYINTLLRDTTPPSSIKIGSRLYGQKTNATFADGEDIKEGSEYECLKLDDFLRERESNYDHFAKKLITRRLEKTGYLPQIISSDPDDIPELENFFESPDTSDYLTEETEFVQSKYLDRERPYFKKLKDKLLSDSHKMKGIGIADESDIETIIQHLSVPKYPIIEKTNILLFYQDWKSGKNLLEASNAINNECANFLHSNNIQNRFARKFSHFKYDMLAQLRRECDLPQEYIGLTNIISMSWGLPRNLLMLLKHIFDWAVFNGETPFKGNPISKKSQISGVRQACKWFFDDAKLAGDDGLFVQDAIQKLGELFRSIRFSDKPSECSISAFSCDLSRASEESRRIIDVALKRSLLIDVGLQKDRNSQRMDRKFQINRMLAPLWDLPLSRRGTIALNQKEVDSIFDHCKQSSFQVLLKLRVERMNAPAFGRGSWTHSNQPKQRSLYDGMADD